MNKHKQIIMACRQKIKPNFVNLGSLVVYRVVYGFVIVKRCFHLPWSSCLLFLVYNGHNKSSAYFTREI